jgi:hypothetical protein
MEKQEKFPIIIFSLFIVIVVVIGLSIIFLFSSDKEESISRADLISSYPISYPASYSNSSNPDSYSAYNDEFLETIVEFNGDEFPELTKYYISDYIRLNDGKFLLTGNVYINQTNFDVHHLVLIKFNKDGSIDKSFNNKGYVLYQDNDFETRGIKLGQDWNGKYIVSGSINFRSAMWRFNENGSLDESFGNNGVSVSTNILPANYLLVDPEEKRYLLGLNINAGYSTIAYKEDGKLDKEFGKNGFYEYDLSSVNLEGLVKDGEGNYILLGYDFFHMRPFVVKVGASGIANKNFDIEVGDLNDKGIYPAFYSLPFESFEGEETEMLIGLGVGGATRIDLFNYKVNSQGKDVKNDPQEGMSFGSNILFSEIRLSKYLQIDQSKIFIVSGPLTTNSKERGFELWEVKNTELSRVALLGKLNTAFANYGYNTFTREELKEFGGDIYYAGHVPSPEVITDENGTGYEYALTNKFIIFEIPKENL